MPQVLFVLSVRKYVQTPPSPPYFPQVNPQVVFSYVQTPPSPPYFPQVNPQILKK